ncbi:MAG: DUF3226 domain-containing protein [Candidatus Micrarchaeaceae archaeon]
MSTESKDKIKIKDNIDRLLLVEGKDEVGFFEPYIEHLSNKGELSNASSIQIINVGGIRNFSLNFGILSSDDKFKQIIRFGFIRDAEENSKEAFDSIKDIIAKYGLPVPQEAGTIEKKNNLWTGIFIMPDNLHKGALENLVIKTVKDRKEYKCVEDFIKCIPKYKSTNSKSRRAKASVLAYLASQKEIVNSLGLGASKKYWDFDHKSLSKLKNFIIALMV